MVKTYGNYINGKYVKSKTGKTFKSINPAKPSQILANFQISNKKDLDQAIKAAEKAFPLWKSTPAPKRGEILYKFAELLKREKKNLAKLMSMEMGKVISEGEGDVQEGIDIALMMAAEGRRLYGRTTPSELSNKFCMTTRQPFGVVGLITPWNFPVAIPCWKLMPALICGNTVIFKPSSDIPLLAMKIVELLTKAGLPKGVVNVITGSGRDVGMSIVNDKRIKGISFTGSINTGKTIVANAGLKKVGLELGGKNPIIILEDANLDLALEGVLWGAFGTTGQRCTATSRVIIDKKVLKKFEKKLINAVKKLKLGPGYQKGTDIGPLVNEAALNKTKEYVKIGIKEKAKLLCGGTSPKREGYYHNPTIFTKVKSNMRIAQEEIFGPVLTIISCKGIKEAIQIANNVQYGLSSSIYTNNIKNAFKAIEELETGITYVNSSTIGAEVHLPFGGTKSTGNGTREAGWAAIEEFSEEKTIYIDYSGKLQKAQGIKTGIEKKK